MADTIRQVGSGGVEAVTPFNVRVAPAGTRFYYASAETQVLGLVLRSAVGRPVADYLQEKIWEPIGAEADATWLIDRSGPGGNLLLHQRGIARLRALGLLLAHDGNWRGRQIIPPPGSRTPRVCTQISHSPVPAATVIRSGYWRVSGGCSCSVAYVARRSRRSGQPARHGPHGGPKRGPRSGRPGGKRPLAEPRETARPLRRSGGES